MLNRVKLVALGILGAGFLHADVGSLACNSEFPIAVDCSGSTNIGGVASVTDNFGPISGSAQATSRYGQLGAASSTSFSFATAQNGYSYALATASDELLITAPDRNGSSGLLSVFYYLNGTISTSGAGSAVSQVAIDVNSTTFQGFQVSNQAYTGSVSGNFEAAIPFSFTFGTPFAFDLCLGVATGQGIVPATLPDSGHIATSFCSPGASGPGATTGTAAADFFDTLILSGLRVTDGSGNAVAGVQFASSSGTLYDADGLAPEPQSILLSATGFGLLAVLGRRRSRQPRGSLLRRSRQDKPWHL